MNGIVFCGSDGSNQQICTIAADGSNFTQLTSDSNNYNWVRWSKDGTLILAADMGNRLWIYQADGTLVRQLTNIAASIGLGFFQGDWSPDGTQVVVTGTMTGTGDAGTFDLQIVNADNSGHTAVTLSKKATQSLNHIISWSPDGTKLLFTTSERTTGEAPYAINATVCAPDGSGSTDLLPAVLGDFDFGYLPWRWYADSTNVLAVKVDQQFGRSTLLKSDGVTTTTLAGSSIAPQWNAQLGAMSADEQSFVWNNGPATALMEMAAPNTTPTLLHTIDVSSDGLDWRDTPEPPPLVSTIAAGAFTTGIIRRS